MSHGWNVVLAGCRWHGLAQDCRGTVLRQVEQVSRGRRVIHSCCMFSASIKCQNCSVIRDRRQATSVNHSQRCHGCQEWNGMEYTEPRDWFCWFNIFSCCQSNAAVTVEKIRLRCALVKMVSGNWQLATNLSAESMTIPSISSISSTQRSTRPKRASASSAATPGESSARRKERTLLAKRSLVRNCPLGISGKAFDKTAKLAHGSGQRHHLEQMHRNQYI